MTSMTTPRLPELPALLDPGALAARLAVLRDPRGTIAGATPYYLRWKPGTSALLGVRLAWRTGSGGSAGIVETLASLYFGDGLSDAADKAATLRLVEPALGPALARLDDALYLAFPNDRLLRGLSAAADPRRLINRIAAVGAPAAWAGARASKRRSQVRAVRWKPGRRAVLELDFVLSSEASHRPWRAFARVLPARLLAAHVERWRAAESVPAVAAPHVLCVDAERGWFATSVAPGRALAAEPGAALRDAIGAALAALHATHAPALAVREGRADLIAAVRALDALAAASDFGNRSLSLAALLRSGLAELAPIAPVFTHGDLGADQMLVDGDHVALIDWDEAANGDPHADWASLRADLRSRGIASEWVEPLARRSLGARFDGRRFRWQCAAQEARRVVEALQRGRADWRARALEGLAAAERALAGGDAPAAPPRSRAADWLAALADPARRAELPGLDAAASRVGAVWPDAEGAIVRIERASAPGPVARWLRLGDDVQAFEFPCDPALPALARALANGTFVPAGHRFGKRAVVRERGGSRHLFLRPEGQARKAFDRVSDAYRRLEAAGVPASRPLAFAPEWGGWWAESIPGCTLDVADAPVDVWMELGAILARVHDIGNGSAGFPGSADHGAASGGIDAAIRAGRKQVSLVRLADPVFAEELDRDLSEIPSSRTTGRLAWIHGDLHPMQILVGERLVILDWERARMSEAEEDLGNLVAHLAWESTDAAPQAWRRLLAGYAAAGGAWDAGALHAHALAALARVRAVHGWRDGSREHARDTARWRAWCRSLAS